MNYKARLIHKKRGNSISKSAYANYPLWKLACDLSYDEISMLITDRKHKLKYEKDENEKSSLRRDIMILIDAYQLKRNSIYKINREENIRNIFNVNDLGFLACSLITLLGYSQNTIFREEVISISQKIKLNIPIDILAGCIVKEVLEKYNSIYDDEDIIEFCRISENKFYENYIICSLWCRKNHWKM